MRADRSTLGFFAVAATLTLGLASCAAGANQDDLQSALADSRTLLEGASLAGAPSPKMPALAAEECDGPNGGSRQATEWSGHIADGFASEVTKGLADTITAHGFPVTRESSEAGDADWASSRTFESGGIRVETDLRMTDGAATFTLTAATGCR